MLRGRHCYSPGSWYRRTADLGHQRTSIETSAQVLRDVARRLSIIAEDCDSDRSCNWESRGCTSNKNYFNSWYRTGTHVRRHHARSPFPRIPSRLRISAWNTAVLRQGVSLIFQSVIDPLKENCGVCRSQAVLMR